MDKLTFPSGGRSSRPRFRPPCPRVGSWPIGLIWIVCLNPGCGRSGVQGVSGPQPEFGPHGGVVVALPHEMGFAEVHLDVPERVGNRAGDQLLAWFYGPDRQSPLRTSVTDVAIALEFPDGTALPILLTPGSEPGQFVSAPAASPHDVDPLVGTLSASLDGEAFESKFAGR